MISCIYGHVIFSVNLYLFSRLKIIFFKGIVRSIYRYSIAGSLISYLLELLFFILYRKGDIKIVSFPKVSKVLKIFFSYFQFSSVRTHIFAIFTDSLSQRHVRLGLSIKKIFKNSNLVSLLLQVCAESFITSRRCVGLMLQQRQKSLQD